MATTRTLEPHTEVGDTVFDSLVETAAVVIDSEYVRDDGTVSLALCHDAVRDILRIHGVTACVLCIEASEKHTPSDVGSKGGKTLGEELQSLAREAVVEAALDSLISDGTIEEGDIDL